MGRLSPVAVAMLLVLAGCSGVVGPDDGGARTVAPALQGSPSPTPSPTSTPDFPPGVWADGVDVRALATAHDAALADGSVTVRTNATIVARNGTTLVASRSAIRSDGPRLRYSLVTTERLPGGETTRRELAFWTDGEVTVLRRMDANGTVTFSVAGSGPPAFAPTDDTGEGALYPRLEDWNLTVAGRERRGNRTLTVLRAGGSPADSTGASGFENASAVVLVTDRGVVRSYTLTYDLTLEGVEATRTATFRVSDVGNTTAPRPEWFDRARDAENVSGTGTSAGTAGADD